MINLEGKLAQMQQAWRVFLTFF